MTIALRNYKMITPRVSMFAYIQRDRRYELAELVDE